jgi:ABC-type iron transport system FetAB ATPase subunit
MCLIYDVFLDPYRLDLIAQLSKIKAILDTLGNVALDDITLGQGAATLSGGEARLSGGPGKYPTAAR